MDDTIRGMREDLDYLRYTEIKDIKKDIEGIKVGMAENKQWTKQMTSSYEKMSTTMGELGTALTKLSCNMEQSSEKTEELTREIESMSRDVRAIDSKSKIDITEIQRDKTKDGIKNYLIGGGLMGGIFVIVQLIEKFL